MRILPVEEWSPANPAAGPESRYRHNGVVSFEDLGAGRNGQVQNHAQDRVCTSSTYTRAILGSFPVRLPSRVRFVRESRLYQQSKDRE